MHEAIERDGYLLLPAVLPRQEAEEVVLSLSEALQTTREDAPLSSQEGTVYAARNVLNVWPEVAALWRRSPLLEVLGSVLGEAFGLVRVLFFDKPPGHTWALPWHKDMTIAVKDNRPVSQRFRKPTSKAGVPHIEAPEEVLNSMLTARLHLDDVTEENGPLKVIPGSHQTGKKLVLGDISPRTILVESGDVLLMRPLLAHSSGRSHPETTRHRRILHLEFAASAELPDGFAWHTFIPAQQSGVRR
jgi:hypothetical protein